MIMRNLTFSILLVCTFIISGCATTQRSSSRKPTRKESIETLKTVASAVSGKELTDDDVKDLGKQIRNDPEAKSAIESITQSVTGTNRVVKYCPLTGKRYASHIIVCPEHDVELKILDE